MGDFNIEKLLSEIKFKETPFHRKEEIGAFLIEERKRQRALLRRRRSFMWRWSAAATVALVVGMVAFYQNAEVRYLTQGDSLLINLPDHSTVDIKEHSEIRYNRLAWYLKRELVLSGKADFSVTKGKRFTVNTSAGTVSVLGTKFLVAQSEEQLHVDCYEGRVKVEVGTASQIVNAGESVDCNKDGIQLYKQPQPLPEYLTYDNVPLINILEELEQIYQVTFLPKDICMGLYFTGAVATDNLDDALDVVLSSCALTYSKKGTQIIISN